MFLGVSEFGLISWATIIGFVAVTIASGTTTGPGRAIRTAFAWLSICSMGYWWRDFLLRSGDFMWVALMTLAVLGWVLYARVETGLEASALNPNWYLMLLFLATWIIWIVAGGQDNWLSTVPMAILVVSYYIGVRDWSKEP